MILSTTAEYALRIMVVLAAADEQPTTSERVAAQAGVPADYTVKVLQMLARAKLVRAQRGRGGGFRLEVEPDEITLLDVVSAIDPIERMTTCPLDRPLTDGHLCRLHHQLDELVARVRDMLKDVTLAKLVARGGQPPLCPPVSLTASNGTTSTNPISPTYNNCSPLMVNSGEYISSVSRSKL